MTFSNCMRKIRQIETCQKELLHIMCKKCNFNFGAFVGFIV